ncbi:MAG: radical SAM protein, partial [Spirochaetes bacterium]|nr:radical SAM protein [Spirochaetota bacterium]
ELVRALEKKKSYTNIKNLWIKKGTSGVIRNSIRPAFSDLNKLPFPDKDLFNQHFNVGDNYIIMTSFGCPYRCTYCSNDLFLNMYKGKGCFIRRRSPENVIAELKEAKKKYKLKIINFMDDIFTTDKKWLKKFTTLYKIQINLPYRAISHPKQIDNEIARMLKNSGCYRVEFGVQSINAEVRKNILKRYETNEDIAEAFSVCEKHKLEFMIDHIYGIPTEDETQQMEAARFYSDFKPARVANFWLVYYPKTAIIDTALKMKLLSKNDVERIENGYIKTYHDHGSVQDKKRQKMFENFAVFFMLIPLLPRSWNKKLSQSKFLFKLHMVPYFIQIFLDFLGGIKYKDYDTLMFAKYYFKYMFKTVLIKLKLKKY